MSDNRSFPLVYAPVRTMLLYVTEQCNLRCEYCFVDKKPRRMGAETARKAMDFLLSRNVSGAESTLNIGFFGGEPFLEQDRMEEVIEYGRRYRPNVHKQFEFSATTNGTIATPRVERLLQEHRMRLLISMDGRHGASAHRPYVSGKPSYDTVARNLPKLAFWAVEAIVRMTFHPGALDLVGNVRHALELGAPSVALCPVEEAAWAGHQAALDDAYEALADWYIQEARQGQILPLEVTHAFLYQRHAALEHGLGRPSRPCGVGTHLLAIDPDGNVMPCHRFLYRKGEWLGTVDQADLPVERMQYVHLSAADILGCDACPAQPVCGGGCRAVALNAGLGLYGAHPGYCITMRAHARAVYRIYDTLTAEGNVHFRKALSRPRPLAGALAELITR